MGDDSTADELIAHVQQKEWFLTKWLRERQKAIDDAYNDAFYALNGSELPDVAGSESQPLSPKGLIKIILADIKEVNRLTPDKKKPILTEALKVVKEVRDKFENPKTEEKDKEKALDKLFSVADSVSRAGRWCPKLAVSMEMLGVLLLGLSIFTPVMLLPFMLPVLPFILIPVGVFLAGAVIGAVGFTVLKNYSEKNAAAFVADIKLDDDMHKLGNSFRK